MAGTDSDVKPLGENTLYSTAGNTLVQMQNPLIGLIYRNIYIVLINFIFVTIPVRLLFLFDLFFLNKIQIAFDNKSPNELEIIKTA